MHEDKIMKLLDNRPFNPSDDGTLVCCNSRGYFMITKCEKCEHDIDFILWIIVDGEKRPDLLQQIMEGNLHDPKCPRCGNINHLNADLLLFLQNKSPVLIFSPTDITDVEKSNLVGRSFLFKLRQQLGANWNNEWYEKDGKRGVFTVARQLLPMFIKMGT